METNRCYGCGSAEGSSIKLCPRCIADRKAAQAARTLEARGGPKSLQSFEPRLTVFNSSLLRFLAAALFYSIIFLLFALWGPVKDREPTLNLLIAGAFASYILSVLTWLLLWMELLVDDLFWAIIALVLPLVLYIHILINPGRIRLLFLSHLTLFTVSFLCTVSVAHAMSTDVKHAAAFILVFLMTFNSEKAFEILSFHPAN